MTRRTAVDVVMLIAMTAVAFAQPTAPTVVVAPGAGGEGLADTRVRTERHAKPGSDDRTQRGVSLNLTFVQFVSPDEVVRIQVDHYDARVGTWGAREQWTDDSVGRALLGLLTSRAEGMWNMILWSEGNVWSVDATVVFKSGNKGRVLYDGLHVCYEDPDGYRWFFRVPLTAQETGGRK